MEEAISRLEGTWVGTGVGVYPTIDAFRYRETVTLARLPGKPVLFYQQRTQGADGQPLHSEAGYYRFEEDGWVELVIAQPTGIVEVHRGRFADGALDLSPVALAATPTAVEVKEVRRRLEVEGDVLRYRLEMAAVGQPLQVHLEADLARQRD
jgi:hypothetical protein